LCLCGGLDILKIDKISLIYSVSCFNLGGLGDFFGGISPSKHPHGDGTVFNNGLQLLLLDIPLTAPPSLDQINYSRKNP